MMCPLRKRGHISAPPSPLRTSCTFAMGRAAVYGPFGVIYCGRSSPKIASANSIANYTPHSSRKNTRYDFALLESTHNVSIGRMMLRAASASLLRVSLLNSRRADGGRSRKWAWAISHVWRVSATVIYSAGAPPPSKVAMSTLLAAEV